jgi:hypothetical protein
VGGSAHADLDAGAGSVLAQVVDLLLRDLGLLQQDGGGGSARGQAWFLAEQRRRVNTVACASTTHRLQRLRRRSFLRSGGGAGVIFQVAARRHFGVVFTKTLSGHETRRRYVMKGRQSGGERREKYRDRGDRKKGVEIYRWEISADGHTESQIDNIYITCERGGMSESEIER